MSFSGRSDLFINFAFDDKKFMDVISNSILESMKIGGGPSWGKTRPGKQIKVDLETTTYGKSPITSVMETLGQVAKATGIEYGELVYETDLKQIRTNVRAEGIGGIVLKGGQ